MLRKISIVLSMPAKISGGGRKFQGFRGGWNKWEAQLVEAHKRLRDLTKAPKLEIQPHSPPDILGCFVLVPAAGEQG